VPLWLGVTDELASALARSWFSTDLTC